MGERRKEIVEMGCRQVQQYCIGSERTQAYDPEYPEGGVLQVCRYLHTRSDLKPVLVVVLCALNEPTFLRACKRVVLA
jgi:hypothetical protein